MYESKRAVLIGLIGTNIGASVAPELHMSAGERANLRYVYKLIDLAVLGLKLEHIPDLIESAVRMGFSGLAVTHPCKLAVIPHLDELSSSAAQLNAVNTIVFREGRRYGHNTDWVGFREAFRMNLGNLPRGKVVLLGAGGAGAAVALALLLEGVSHLTVFDSDPERSRELVERLGGRFGLNRISVGSEIEESIHNASGLVNATPIGMVAHPGSPIDLALLRKNLWVADIIYSPRETPLLARAHSLGASTMNGGSMVVLQAAEQIKLFTGTEPDVAQMVSQYESFT